MNAENKCFILQDAKLIYPSWDNFANDPIQKDDISHHFTASSYVILHFTNKFRPLKTITKITNPTIQ